MVYLYTFAHTSAVYKSDVCVSTCGIMDAWEALRVQVNSEDEGRRDTPSGAGQCRIIARIIANILE